jgi:sister-chromatid-cohesion protein PDS5
LRLVAGVSLLKIAAQKRAEHLEPLDFAKLGLLVQDPIFSVREKFQDTICNLVAEEKLGAKYCILLLLAAHEPERELRTKLKAFVSRQARRGRLAMKSSSNVVETYYVDFLHLLSHHPDFSFASEDLKLFEVYIRFFLEAVAVSDNVSYLYCVSAQLKSVKDRLAADSENLYALSELSQTLIRELCASNSWSLQTFPGKIGMPRDLFQKLEPSETSQVLKTVYLESKSDFLRTRENKTQGKRNTPAKKIQKRVQRDSPDSSDSDTSDKENPSKRNRSFSTESELKSSPVRRSTRTKTIKTSNLADIEDSD